MLREMLSDSGIKEMTRSCHEIHAHTHISQVQIFSQINKITTHLTLNASMPSFNTLLFFFKSLFHKAFSKYIPSSTKPHSL